MLFDTSVLIHYLRRSNQTASSYVEAVIAGTAKGICSVVTEAELWAGIRDPAEELRAAVLLEKFELIPLSSETARLAGRLMQTRSDGEAKAHFGDSLIAATAAQQGETILTADGKSERVFGDSTDYLVFPS